MSRRSAPNEPRILSSPEEGVVSSPYADHFELRWKIPADNGEPIDNYQIKFCAVRRVSGDWIATPDACNTEELSGGEQPELRIGDLVSDTHYKVELRAHNAIGYSTPAELIVKTARGEQYYRYLNNSCSVCGHSVSLLLFVLFSSMCFAH
ncbi:Fasciclin 2 [Carabus blaptoides fortunei]